MEKNCLYCGTPFSTNRESKKYCKDNCKQLAYLQRCGMVRSGNAVKSLIQHQSPINNIKNVAVKDAKHTTPVNDVNPVNDVKYVNAVKSINEVNYANENTIPLQLVEQFFSQMTQVIEVKIEKALENIRLEFKNSIDDKTTRQYQASAFCSAETFSGLLAAHSETKTIKRCHPCLVEFVRYRAYKKPTLPNQEKENSKKFFFKEPKLKDQSEKQAEIISINRNSDIRHDSEQYLEEQWDDDWDDEERDMEDGEAKDFPEKMYCIDLADDEPEVQMSQQIKSRINDNHKKNLLEKELKENSTNARQTPDNRTDEIVNPESKEVIETGPIYDWIESKLIKRMERLYIHNDMEIKFRYPHSYWGIEETQIVSWVNIRLRCLLENLIRLSNFSYIDRETFSVLTSAFVSLVKSETFQSLPSNYHYTEVITELTIKLNTIKKANNADEIRIQFPMEKKAVLVVIRKQLLHTTTSVKFSQLYFDEVRFVYPVPTKPIPENTSNEKVADEKSEPKEWEKLAAEAIRLKNLKKAS